jgi:hypothetical protein
MNNRVFLLYLTGFMLAFALLWLVAFEPPTEDAFISMRCARNLCEGHGLVFNPGQRVEAMSNLLWTLLLAALGCVLDNYLIASQLLGFIFSALSLVFILVLARRADMQPKAIILAGALLVLSPYFLTFTVYGLESPLQILLLLGLLWGIAEGRWTAAGLALGLLPAVRPEGYFFIPPVLLLIFLWERRKIKWLHFLTPLLVLTAAVLLFRFIYYGELLPNTVYSKSIALVPELDVYLGKIGRGLVHCGHYFLDARLFLWIPLLVLAFAGKLTGRAAVMRRWAAALALIQLAFVIISGGNVFLRYRFLSALYPMLCLLAAAGLNTMLGFEKKNYHVAIAAALAVAGVLGQVEFERSGKFYWHRRLQKIEPYKSPQALVAARWNQLGKRPDTINARLGQILRVTYEPGTLIATGQIGQIGYYSELPILDVVGLADWKIAHEGATLDYLLEDEPALFLLMGSPYLGSAPNVGMYNGMLGTSRFRRLYEWTRVYQAEPLTETYYWIERRLLPLDEAPRRPDRYRLMTLDL